MKKLILSLSILIVLFNTSCSTSTEDIQTKNVNAIQNETVLSRTVLNPVKIETGNNFASRDAGQTSIYLSSDGIIAPRSIIVPGITTYGAYQLTQQGDSNLVLKQITMSGGQVVASAGSNLIWNAGCVQPINQYNLVNQSDGNVVIYRGQNYTIPNAIWHTNTQTSGTVSQYLELVVYSKNTQLWGLTGSRKFIRLSIIQNNVGNRFNIFNIQIEQ